MRIRIWKLFFRFGIFLVVMMASSVVMAQTAVYDRQPVVHAQSLVAQGWIVQHESLSFDGLTLYFSARRAGETHYNLYSARRTRNVWSEPERMSEEINCEDTDALWPSISPDEQELYFARRYRDTQSKKSSIKTDLFVSVRQGGGWTQAQPLVISNGNFTSPQILSDGETLLYSACLPDAKSKSLHYGLYCSRKSGLYHWTIPEALAVMDDENIHLYGPKVLHHANGSYQVQMTQQIVNRHDTTYMLYSVVLPEAMAPRPCLTLRGTVCDATDGSAIAATIRVMDALTQTSLAVHHTTDLGIFSIALPYGQKYSLDISGPQYSHRYMEWDCTRLSQDTLANCSVELVRSLDVVIYLFDAETNTSLGEQREILAIDRMHRIALEREGYESQYIDLDARKPVLLPSSEMDVLLQPGKCSLSLLFVDGESGETLEGEVVLTNQSREQSLVYAHAPIDVRQGDNYRLSANVQGYVYFDTLMHVPMSADPMTMRIPLNAIRQSMVVQMKNIQFGLASSDLTEDSYPELNRVVRMMKDNPELRLEIAAHTDNQGSDAMNQVLSERRGETVKRYLVHHGVSGDRLIPRGYGKSRPLVDNDTEEHRAINRRVEFKVIDL